MFGFLSKIPSSTSHESSDGASPLQPGRRRNRKECVTTVAEATVQAKSSMVNVTNSCRNPNRNSPAQAKQAHRAGQKGNDWDQPQGAAGSILWSCPVVSGLTGITGQENRQNRSLCLKKLLYWLMKSGLNTVWDLDAAVNRWTSDASGWPHKGGCSSFLSVSGSGEKIFKQTELIHILMSCTERTGHVQPDLQSQETEKNNKKNV